MITMRWQVRLTPAEMSVPARPLPFVADLPEGWDEWLQRSEVVPGTPFLLSPSFTYDVVVNEFFQSVEMMMSARNTQVGYARDLAAFLTFLSSAREGRSWRDATEADHLAYLFWRRRDPEGPRASGAAWDREVAAVNRFYRGAAAGSRAGELDPADRATVGAGGGGLGASRDARRAAPGHVFA